MYQTQVSKARLRGSFWAFLDLIPNVVIGLLLLLGGIATSRHELTLGGLVAFITLTLLLVWPIEAMGYILASGQEAATAAQRVYEIFDTEPAITGPPVHAAPPAAVAGTGQRAPARLVFERVEFRYPGADRPVLRGVSLELEPGQTLALTGATGAGKTTLLQLVPRLADPVSGRITLDGTDIRAMQLGTLRARVGCAFEEATLFSASVRENVSFGAPDATDSEVEQALAAAQAGFVHDLPWGLDTRIGEQGMTLSGGQRQRIALARAILARPSVLVLDDPLSALDVHTEEKVSRALREVLAGTTALVVAHRPSTVALADKVALLADGVIVALGTHAELLRTQPRYRHLMSGATGEGGDGGATPGRATPPGRRWPGDRGRLARHRRRGHRPAHRRRVRAAAAAGEAAADRSAPAAQADGDRDAPAGRDREPGRPDRALAGRRRHRPGHPAADPRRRPAAAGAHRGRVLRRRRRPGGHHPRLRRA